MNRTIMNQTGMKRHNESKFGWKTNETQTNESTLMNQNTNEHDSINATSNTHDSMA